MFDSFHIGLRENDSRIPQGLISADSGINKMNPFSLLSGEESKHAHNVRRGVLQPRSGGTSATAVKDHYLSGVMQQSVSESNYEIGPRNSDPALHASLGE